MATTYTGWVADGRPWRNCQPLLDLIATLRGHGYTGPGSGIGDQSHLTANPPEDHCPYSHTPWPGAQPYPYVLAIDLMPGAGLDIIDLGGRLFDDKSSNKPGTQPIKYLNWTDSDGNCWHDSWMPNHTRFVSTDRGHIHVSFRTDYVTSHAMAGYDPYGPPDPNGDNMASLDLPQKAWLYNAANWAYAQATVVGSVFFMNPDTGAETSYDLTAYWAKVGAAPAVELTPAQVALISGAAHDGAAGAIDGATISSATISTAG